MATFRVGVDLHARVKPFRSAFRGAASETARLRGRLVGAGRVAGAAGGRMQRAARGGAKAFDKASGAARRLSNQVGAVTRAAAPVEDVFQRAGGAVGRMVRRGARGMARVRSETTLYTRTIRTMRTEARSAANDLWRMGRGLLAGAAGFEALRRAARGEMDLERAITQLRLDAEVDKTTAAEWRAQIERAAQDPTIRAPLSEVMAGVAAHGRLTGRYEDSVAAAPVIARLIQRSGGASGAEVGALAGHFGLFEMTSSAEVDTAFAMLMQAQKSGAVGVSDWAAGGGRAMANWRAAPGEVGRDPMASLKDMLALSQAVYRVTNNVDTTITSMEAGLASLTDARKLELMRKAGIRQPDTRPTVDVFRDLAALPVAVQSEIFDVRARDNLKAFRLDVPRTTMAEVYAGLADVDALLTKYHYETEEAAQNTLARTQGLTDRGQIFFGKVLRKLGADSMAHWALNNPLTTAGVALTGAALWKGRRLRRRVQAERRKAPSRPAGFRPAQPAGRPATAKPAARPATAKPAARPATAKPAARPATAKPAARLQRMAGAGRDAFRRAAGGVGLLARRLPLLATAATALAAGKQAVKGDWHAAGGEVVTGGGALAGLKLGAALGTAILPVGGTLIGGMLGAGLGAWGLRSAFRAATRPTDRAAQVAESAERDRPRRSVRWRTRGKRRADAGGEEVDATAAAEPDKPRRSVRADVQTRELAIAPPAMVVDNRRIDRRINTTVNLQVPPGADAEEIARRVAEEVERVNREIEARRRDEIDSIVTDRNLLVTKY